MSLVWAAIAIVLVVVGLTDSFRLWSGTMMIIPSTMADSMGAGSYAGLAAYAAQRTPEK